MISFKNKRRSGIERNPKALKDSYRTAPRNAKYPRADRSRGLGKRDKVVMK